MAAGIFHPAVTGFRQARAWGTWFAVVHVNRGRSRPVSSAESLASRFASGNERFQLRWRVRLRLCSSPRCMDLRVSLVRLSTPDSERTRPWVIRGFQMALVPIFATLRKHWCLLSMRAVSIGNWYICLRTWSAWDWVRGSVGALSDWLRAGSGRGIPSIRTSDSFLAWFFLGGMASVAHE